MAKKRKRSRDLSSLTLDLACPAGVEPATYGLEGLKNLQRQYLTMVYSALVLGVHFGSDFVGSPGVSCGGHGIHSHMSGKLTFIKHLTMLPAQHDSNVRPTFAPLDLEAGANWK
jgi:hypothetical protein